MSLKQLYPNVEQWVSNRGTLEIKTNIENKIQIALGDAGGVPEDGYIIALTIEAAMIEAEKKLENWLKETKRLLDDLQSGNLKTTEDEYLLVTGWPKIRNPYFDKNEA